MILFISLRTAHYAGCRSLLTSAHRPSPAPIALFHFTRLRLRLRRAEPSTLYGFYLSPRPSHDLNGFYIFHSTFYILPFKRALQHPTKHRLRRLQLPLRQPPLCLYVGYHGRKTGLEGEGRIDEWYLFELTL